MRMEHLACFGQRAQIRGIVLSDDGILRERLQEDGVDDGSCFTVDAFGLGPGLDAQPRLVNASEFTWYCIVQLWHSHAYPHLFRLGESYLRRLHLSILPPLTNGPYHPFFAYPVPSRRMLSSFSMVSPSQKAATVHHASTNGMIAKRVRPTMTPTCPTPKVEWAAIFASRISFPSTFPVHCHSFFLRSYSLSPATFRHAIC
jgi:hypothetical protein